ncbi:Chromosome partition protein Smc [Nostoc sp. DSM 114160]|jgi:chromosome segregation ATPase
MKRGDRRDSNYDNAVNNPRSRQKEPASPRELQQLLMTVRAQRDEAQQRAKENQEAASQLVHVRQKIETYQIEANELKEQVTQNYRFYIDEQENHQKTLYLYNEEKAKISQLVHVHQREILTYQLEANELKEQVTQNYRFYIDEQQSHQQTLCIYNEEKAKATELLTKYESVNSERQMYLTLYNEAKAELKHERRSKASIKGWETRRKAENEKLKREIAQMVVLVRDSLASKDEAVNSLYVVAERMDRIQSLVDSVEEETTNNPIGVVQKFKRIWLAIKDILAE